MDPMKMIKSPWIIPVVVLLVIGSGVMSILAYANSLYNRGVEYETRLSALYESNQNQLSQYITSWYEQTGLMQYKTERMDSIITGAVMGRYGPNGFTPEGAFFAAVSEAYPDLAGLSIIDDMRRFTEAGRARFANDQTVLLDNLRSFEQWQRTGLIRNIIVDRMFPTENLQARIGGRVVATGDAALAQIRTLVLSEQGNQAFTTGTQEALSIR